MIKQLISCYWRIALLKDSPEHTPYSLFLLLLSGLLLLLIMTAQWVIASFDFSNDLLLELAASASLILSFVLYTAVVLWLKKLSIRFTKTATSLFVTHIFIHLFALPLFILDPYLTNAHLKNPIFSFIAVIYLFITLGLSVWQFVITAHIYKHALSTTPIQSVLAAFGLVAVNVLTISLWR